MEYLEKADCTMTIKEWLQYWFEVYAKRNIKQSTAISYIGYINNHLVPQIGEYRLSEINTNLLQEFFNNRMDFGGRKCGPLSPKTLHNMKLMLHKSMKKAVELELLQRNYAEFVELPRQSKPNMRVLNVDEQRQLVTTLRHTNEKLYIGAMISLATGLRLGEVLGLQWSDIDYSNGMLHIRRTVNRLCTIDGDTKTEIVVGTPKSDSSVRDIPFNFSIQKEEEIKKLQDDISKMEKKILEIEKKENEKDLFAIGQYLQQKGTTAKDFLKDLMAQEKTVTGGQNYGNNN